MLKNNLKDISNIVLLRSDKILYELLKNDETISNKSSSYEYGMRDFYPNTFRKNAIKNSMEYTLSESRERSFTLEYKFEFLDSLFDEYLKIDGNHIYAKPRTLHDYSSLISKVHPFNIIGYVLAKKLKNNELIFYNITEFTKYITPLALNTNRDFKEYAENHIHLGGSTDVSLNFMAILSNDTSEMYYNPKLIDSLPRINEFSYINNHDLTFGNLIDIAKYCVSVINTKLLDFKLTRNIKSDLEILLKYGKLSMIDLGFCSFEILEKFTKEGMNIKKPLLKELIKYKKDDYTSKQWFLYNILIFDLFETTNEKDIRRVIKVFLHIMNILRSYMVMSQNIGLSHFSEFSRSHIRREEPKIHNNIASNIISNGTSKVEAKITPDSILNNEYIKYKLAFDKEIIKKESSNISKVHEKYFLNTSTSKRNYHFCVHFVRVDEKISKNDTLYVSPRFHKLRKELKSHGKKLNDFLYKKSNIVNKYDFYRRFFSDKLKVLKNEKALKNQYLDLSKLITTLDIAGDESRTPPEVFAPIIKYLRRDIKKLDNFKASYIKYQKDGHDFIENYRLRLSVHAGEDFNHIVTGMRKVHETIKFYHMKEKDRLGHALSIGLEPKKWCEQNGDIFVTKHEHLDNLVWLYHQITEILPYYKKAEKLRIKYEKIIKELFDKIYKFDSYVSIDDMYKAWKLREFCPLLSFGEDNSELDNDEYSKIAKYNNILDKKKYDEDTYKKARVIFKRYHTCSKVRKRGDEVIKIVYENKNFDLCKYYICDDELELIKAVQDRFIQKICNKGIIIETNPSSNVYIAHINKYEYHPIFRWNPIEDKHLQSGKRFNKFGIRKSRLNVCVNTDDPAIMPTTLRNEFDLLERTALGVHSKSKENIKSWSEKVRKFGLEVFDYDHQVSEFTRVN